MRLEMLVLVFFYHPASPERMTGGFHRVCEVARRISTFGVRYILIENSPSLLKGTNHLTFEVGTPFDGLEENLSVLALKALFSTFYMPLLALKLARKVRFSLILSPSETSWSVLPAYFMHLVTGVPLVIVAQLPPGKGFSGSAIKVYDWHRQHGMSILNSLLMTFWMTFDSALMPRIFNKANIIAVSEGLKKMLRDMEVKSKIYVVGNGISIEKEPCEFKEKLYDAIFVGRLVPEKGIFDLIQVWERVIAIRPSAKLAIVGYCDPQLREALELKIEKGGLKGSIEIAGYVPENKKATMLSLSKLLIYPSRVESFSLIIAEALAHGLTVLCYNIPGTDHYASCGAVTRVTVGDIDSLALYVCKLLDADNLRELSESARNYARKFDWNEVVAKEAETYAKILGM